MNWTFIAEYWHTILGVIGCMTTSWFAVEYFGGMRQKVLKHEQEHKETPYALVSVVVAQNNALAAVRDSQYRELITSINGLQCQMTEIKRVVETNEDRAERRYTRIVDHLIAMRQEESITTEGGNDGI